MEIDDVIKKALDELYTKVASTVPSGFITLKQYVISNVSPIDLPRLMVEKGIPATAYFSVADRESDGYMEISLEWKVMEPMTEEKREAFIKRKFNYLACMSIHAALKSHGYVAKKEIPHSVSSTVDSQSQYYNCYASGHIAEISEYFSNFY